MNKSLRVNLIVTMILVLSFILLKAALQRSIDGKTAEALKIEEAIKIAKNENLKLIGYYQSITIEDSIVPFVTGTLGMIKNNDTLGIIEVKHVSETE